MRCLLLCAVFLCTVPLLCLAQSPTPDLPSFPSDPLRINIEATIYRTNVSSGELTEYTGYYEEYRDSANNRGLAITFTNSSETRYYYDLDVKQGFNVVRGPMVPLEQAECTTHDIKTNENGFVEIFQFTKGAQNSLVFADTPTFFQWNPNALPIFQDITEVRGIPASSWFISSSDTSPFNLTYYFSYNSHKMPYYNGVKPVPLRVVMDGSRASSSGDELLFHHVYDFNLVAPLGVVEDNFFSTPKGVYCPQRKAPKDSERSFADQYIISEQVVSEKTSTLDYITTYVDHNLNLTRMDYDVPTHNGYRRLKVLHDFTQGFQMMIDLDTEKCNVTSIPTKGFVAWDVATDSNGRVHLLSTKDQEIIKDASYQGMRVENGIPIDVWTHKKMFDNGTVTISELFYTHPSWKVRASQTSSTSYSVYAGSRFITYNQETHQVLDHRTFHASNQYIGPIQANSNIADDVFDVPECYSLDAASNEHLSFTVEDPNTLFANRQITKHAISRAVKSHFAELGSISPTRIVNVEVFEKNIGNNYELKISFILRSELLRSDASVLELVYNEANNTKVLTIIEAKLATADGIVLPVVATDGSTKYLIIASDLSNDQGEVRYEVAGKSPPKTYSKAAMAGLGFGMLILGALLAVVAGGILWIKRFDINIRYLTQHNEA